MSGARWRRERMPRIEARMVSCPVTGGESAVAMAGHMMAGAR